MSDCPAVFQSTVDKLLKKTNLALVIGTNSWREQFVEAITVSSGRKPSVEAFLGQETVSVIDASEEFFWLCLSVMLR